MAGGATGAAHSNYPHTFSAELIRHCEDGCIPPEVFADARALLDDEHRRRYVRINPRCEERVLDAGAEAILRLDAHSTAARMCTSTLLSPEEQRMVTTLHASMRAGATRASSTATDEAVASQGRKRNTRDDAPRAGVLRLGLAALTGLPLESVEPVAWLPCGVFALPWSYAMGSNPLFRDGTLLAMDAASIAAVVALHPRKGDRVLDLCCAPGMKLGLLADAVTRGHGGGTGAQLSVASPALADGLVVGVDVSLSRLYMTRSTLKKQQQQGGTADTQASLPVCLFAGDGCRFSMESAAAALDLTGSAVDAGTGLTKVEKRLLQRQHNVTTTTAGSKRGRPASGAAACLVSHETESSPPPTVVYAPTHIRAIVAAWLHGKACGSQADDALTTSPSRPQPLLFDRVLVDAECSHDGSVAHMQLGAPHANTADTVRNSAPGTCSASSAVSTIRKGRGVDNEYRMHHMNLGIAEGEVGSQTEKAPSASSQPLASSRAESGEHSKKDAPSPSSTSLFALQSKLLDNGYRQLRPGGTLVYATCSYSYVQNEYVVRRFLERANAVNEKVDQCDVCGRPTVNEVQRRATAVLVPAFSYAHEVDGKSVPGVASDDSVAACVRMDSEEQRRDVQRLLDAHVFDYGTVQRGHDRYAYVEGANHGAPSADEHADLGSRFWPRVFRSSFLYVAKIWKRPPEVTVSVEGGSRGCRE
ncbi:NOL1/NOP2/sun_family_-_putative [Leishmania infantum]|uniref:NOL1/NOP2/sun_family_-_putative n=1 Tax=Leishmania infantum TaxID=5671 RepID=A0A6L0XIY4_LEIIN|nr:NOL1/NOP2/sun_family_-_putative [Leishmania infantum]SUZ43723.1 NOL1/NOP2/sun_family_-_putative [Leishmania infantum]